MVNFYFVVRSIISCEHVEQAGKKLERMCVILQTEIKDQRLKEQLREIAKFVHGLPLKFSLAGFFDINKRLIPSLLNGLTSYMIILIQFKVQEQCQK
uniref:Gustatory receptor 98c isoform X2 n=1 Tax=Diabrotica virgifera virgifera TaxID=50390 RepID=A0A6P7F8A7_DIAVI